MGSDKAVEVTCIRARIDRVAAGSPVEGKCTVAGGTATCNLDTFGAPSPWYLIKDASGVLLATIQVVSGPTTDPAAGRLLR